jgi:hypothetical protein
MSEQQLHPILAFLWRPTEIGDSVVDVSRETSTTAIFDLSASPSTDNPEALKVSGAQDVKISPDSFMDPSIRGFIQDSNVETL